MRLHRENFLKGLDSRFRGKDKDSIVHPIFSHFMCERPMFLDDDLPKHKQPEPFPRKLTGKSVEEMREYRAELVEEIAKIDAEIESRGKVKAAAEGLFG